MLACCMIIWIDQQQNQKTKKTSSFQNHMTPNNSQCFDLFMFFFKLNGHNEKRVYINPLRVMFIMFANYQ